MLTLDDVHTYYGESYVLQGVSLQVKKGSVVALLGRNGMGKTTTIHSIIGFTPPSRGRIRFNERDLTGLKPYQISQLGMALVPQGRRIFSSLSVRENLSLAARGAGKEQAWNLHSVYAYFPILKERARLRGNLLSGGEQQMLSIGRALMTNPDLLLMDEPSEGLAPIIVREISDIITHLKSQGFSILLVEQNLPMVMAVADYVYVISRGKIVFDSTPDELWSNDEIKTLYLGVAAQETTPSNDRKHA